MEKKSLHPVVEEFLKDIPNQVAKAKANSDFLYLVDDIRRHFKDSYMSGWTYAQIQKVEMTFQFEKFSEAKRLLRYLAERGQKRLGKVMELKESQLMIWNFERFQIRGQFKKEGGACHYVKVGTKMVEQDIYELKCPETLDPQFAPVQEIAEVDGDGLPF